MDQIANDYLCSMMFSKFFRLPKFRRFEYQPLYFDPIKEELEERIAASEKEHSAGIQHKTEIAKLYQTHRSSLRRSNQNRTRRLVVIIIILSLLAYFLYF